MVRLQQSGLTHRDRRADGSGRAQHLHRGRRRSPFLPKACVETYNRSLGMCEVVLWNGSRFSTYSASEPERLRGPQHHRAWGDEVAAWPEPDTWDQLMFGMRLGENPQVVVTTTPRPEPLIKRIIATPGAMITRGSTFDNSANLPAGAIARLRERYEGTRLGRQELYAELLEDVQGALWTAGMIDSHRLRAAPVNTSYRGGSRPVRHLGRRAGRRRRHRRRWRWARRAVLRPRDASCNLSPDGWARRVVDTFQKWGADRVVAEKNFGGAMVEAVLPLKEFPSVTHRTPMLSLANAMDGAEARRFAQSCADALGIDIERSARARLSVSQAANANSAGASQ